MFSNNCPRSQVINNLRDRLNQFEGEETAQQLIDNALALSKQIVYTLELSWGGPADGFKIFVDPETKEIIDVIYYYTTWGQYKEEPLGVYELEKVIPHLRTLVSD
ncbi:MAG: hypothetical protein GF383_08595 [Candidatus Lokiarchaeota archaeon]|nr:hypothetical protein [Candidatus Lokiarchaeota archaeon]MBD3340440.1 hypothetical protein [Candidatus Lokiarchaeota archaeon]